VHIDNCGPLPRVICSRAPIGAGRRFLFVPSEIAYHILERPGICRPQERRKDGVGTPGSGKATLVIRA